MSERERERERESGVSVLHTLWEDSLDAQFD